MIVLISVILCAACGAYIAHRDGISRFWGAVIGAVFNVLGVAVLLGVWGAEWIEAKMERKPCS